MLWCKRWPRGFLGAGMGTKVPTAVKLCPPAALLSCARAAEEVLYGKEGVSLTTSREVSRAAELARYLVVDSKLHPLNRDSPVTANMLLGGEEDPTTEASSLLLGAR